MTERMEVLRSQREAIIAIAARHKAINLAACRWRDFGTLVFNKDFIS